VFLVHSKKKNIFLVKIKLAWWFEPSDTRFKLGYRISQN